MATILNKKIIQQPTSGSSVLSTISYVESSGNLIMTTVNGLFFKSDGTKCYISDSADSRVEEFNLTTAWDIAGLDYTDSNYILSTSTNTGYECGLFFGDSGGEMYIADTTSDSIDQYSLTTDWDLSTASYTRTKSVNLQESAVRDIFFRPNGTTAFIVGSGGNEVNQYSLSTAWNISGLSYQKNASLSTGGTTAFSLCITSDGLKMFTIQNTGTGYDIVEWDLGSAWDIGTLTYVDEVNLTESGNMRGIYINSDDSKLYLVANDSIESIYEYDITY